MSELTHYQRLYFENRELFDKLTEVILNNNFDFNFNLNIIEL